MSLGRRRATLVVISRSEVIRGVLGPLELELPWWQETGPIIDVLPGCTVLRLLDADPVRTDEMGGPVTYLVEHDGRIPTSLELQSWPGQTQLPMEAILDRHPLRAPWATVGGPAADVEWAASHVEIDPTRRARQERSWNLSAIWSIPVVDNERASTVWLKCVPPFFSHECHVLELMADQPIPEVLAREGHRILLAEMPGHDGHNPTAAEELAMVDALVDIQAASVGRIDALLDAGVPDFRQDAIVEKLRTLLDRLAPDDAVLQQFSSGLSDRMRQVDQQGLPTVLAHGDPHGGNCRIGVSPPVWFDWGDSLIGNPLLDVAALHRMADPTVGHWLDRWATIVPGSNPHEVWGLLKPVAILRMAWVYQRFCDNIEPAERIYHHKDVADALDDVRRLLTGEPAPN